MKSKLNVCNIDIFHALFEISSIYKTLTINSFISLFYTIL